MTEHEHKSRTEERICEAEAEERANDSGECAICGGAGHTDAICQAPAITDDQYRAAAKRLLYADNGVWMNIDDDAKVSRGQSPGSWVQVWMWVPRGQVEF
jgi:hypothetical protein